jgi:hypothetical protein
MNTYSAIIVVLLLIVLISWRAFLVIGALLFVGYRLSSTRQRDRMQASVTGLIKEIRELFKP